MMEISLIHSYLVTDHAFPKIKMTIAALPSQDALYLTLVIN